MSHPASPVAIGARPGGGADALGRAAKGAEVSMKASYVLQKRLQGAFERFRGSAAEAATRLDAAGPATMLEAMSQAPAYWTDLAQRSILFWDTLRERGNRYLDHVRAGSPPVLSFEYETVLDARTFGQPVNYALVRIVPPAGVKVNALLRPYVIIDPRAGHGPGIGGFKDDSQVGVALKAGHPVYFVIFYPEPEPGQTLTDVCDAERRFVKKVRELHAQSAKPAIIGNCQGGWAAMMLVASDPEQTGPLVINGAPMSYWGGAWSEGEGDNPMRYAGGLLGGTWLSSMVSDLGAGKFDGAWLVQNFENLNPANTFWDKYYHLFSHIDTEPARFLEFERWWGGFFLMNREEIEWITQTLFVGNRAWGGAGAPSGAFDLRAIRVPIVLFASMGDNITPPQQAFNWVGDVYGTTEEIKANGQVIVGLLHQDIGHLGIFVSGKVAKKEHAQIVNVMDAIELLTPGLYAMKIADKPGGGYEVSFEEKQLEDVMKRLNRFGREDEKAFASANVVSEFNQRAYEIFARPALRGFANEDAERVARNLHPLRMQRWSFSDLNPWMAALGPIAATVRANRRALPADAAPRQLERYMSGLLSASLEYYRAVRDAASESAFFQIYGNVLALDTAAPAPAAALPMREQEFARALVASIGTGGYPEAVARVAALLARTGRPIPLARLDLKRELVKKYDALLPRVKPEDWRRVRGEQEVLVELEPEAALAALPGLLPDSADRVRLLSLLDRIIEEGGAHGASPTAGQQATLARVRELLSTRASARLPKSAPRKRSKALT
jgi:pimeloyl-ACP methyl ester carboxylesterase